MSDNLHCLCKEKGDFLTLELTVPDFSVFLRKGTIATGEEKK